MNINRRRFLQGTAALFAAPAIVKADSLMSIWVPPEKKLLHSIDVYESDFGIIKINPTETPLWSYSSGEYKDGRPIMHNWAEDHMTDWQQKIDRELRRDLARVMADG